MVNSGHNASDLRKQEKFHPRKMLPVEFLAQCLLEKASNETWLNSLVEFEARRFNSFYFILIFPKILEIQCQVKLKNFQISLMKSCIESNCYIRYLFSMKIFIKNARKFFEVSWNLVAKISIKIKIKSNGNWWITKFIKYSWEASTKMQ